MITVGLISLGLEIVKCRFQCRLHMFSGSADWNFAGIRV